MIKYLRMSNKFKEQLDRNLVQGNPLLGFDPSDVGQNKTLEFSTPDKDDGGDSFN